MKRLIALILLATATTAASAEQTESANNFNIRSNPLTFLVGAVNATMDYKIADHWTLGPELFYWRLSISSKDSNSSKLDVTAYSAGVRANWFHNGVYTNGLYVGPSVKYASIKLDATDKNGKATNASGDGPFVGAVVGYAWFWNSFNIMAGGGLNVKLGKKIQVTHSDGTTEDVSDAKYGGGLALEGSIGWTF